VCDWMDKEKADCAAIVLCGDFNGPPYEPFHAVLRRLGYVSAHAACHGREPQVAACRAACYLYGALGPPLPGRHFGFWHMSRSLLHVGLVLAWPCAANVGLPVCFFIPFAHAPRCAACAPAIVQGTWPTGIKAPLMDEGGFECLDYVYIWAAPDYNVK